MLRTSQDLRQDPQQVAEVAAGEQCDPVERRAIAQQPLPVSAVGDHPLEGVESRLIGLAVAAPHLDRRQHVQPAGGVQRAEIRDPHLEVGRDGIDDMQPWEVEPVGVVAEQLFG